MPIDQNECDFTYLIKPRSLTHGNDDDIAEEGNIAASSTNLFRDGQSWSLDDSQVVKSRQKEQWLMNYQEAAIYLEEGKNNEKFDTHPKNKSALPAYFIAHHSFFHIIDLIASLLLLSLAIIEKPAVANITVPIEVHASLEIFGITVLAIDLMFKGRWQGAKKFFSHKRSLLKCVLLLVMLVEAIVVIARRTNHFRVTRALRTLFLVDTYYCHGIRRFSRQLLLSLPPILELLVLLLFVMIMFSVLGFYMFSDNPEDPYFVDLEKSFCSLFVLLTTANYPDVMMPAYNRSPVFASFFIVYVAIELYVFMNLFLAVVYSTFTDLEKTKVKKLFLHRRTACQHAFRLLVTKSSPNKMSIRHFCGMMSYYKPNMGKKQLYLMYKTLNTSQSGTLSLNEFYYIYSMCNLSWKESSDANLWFQKLPRPLKDGVQFVHWLVTLKWFDYFIYVVIMSNFVTILYEAIAVSISRVPDESGDRYDYTKAIQVTWYSITFTSIYLVEILLKIIGLGPFKYFTNGWNLFDFSITVVTFFGDVFKDELFVFIILRPIRLIRIFKARRRYRDIFGTLFILADRLWSVVVNLMLVYYIFAIIGMECFSHYDMMDCCKNESSIAPYYANGSGLYFLNNFDDVFKTGVTLFELTVVNNWFIIMEGYAYVATRWSRAYFMLFYLVTMIVMTVIVAFILEAFMFKIQYRHVVDPSQNTDYVINEQCLSMEEHSMVDNAETANWSGSCIVRSRLNPGQSTIKFIGKKKRGKMELSLQMYKDEIKDWIATSNSSADINDSESRRSLSTRLPSTLSTNTLTSDVTHELTDAPLYLHQNFVEDDHLEDSNQII